MTSAEDMAVVAGAALGLTAAGPEGWLAHGRLTVSVERPAWLQAIEWARDEVGCTLLDFLRGADALDADPAGISVVARLNCPQGRHHLLLRTLVPADDLRLPTATGLLRGADRHERETHGIFGVVFTGHPDLDRPVLSDRMPRRGAERRHAPGGVRPR